MSETPEDIREVAEQIAGKFFNGGAIFKGMLAGEIAHAILAERERAATIAEQLDPEKPANYLFKRERIAPAIRASPSIDRRTE